MKKLHLILPLLFFSIATFSQVKSGTSIQYPENVEAPLTKKEKAMIEDVYQAKTKELVYDNEQFLKDIKHLLRNRITIYKESNPKTQKKGMLLSDAPLFNEYNKDLKRDVDFDVENFNPLKYQLDFFANGTYVYRVDDTDYFIQVTSQHRKIKY